MNTAARKWYWTPPWDASAVADALGAVTASLVVLAVTVLIPVPEHWWLWQPVAPVWAVWFGWAAVLTAIATVAALVVARR